jgi:hypothetical protein
MMEFLSESLISGIRTLPPKHEVQFAENSRKAVSLQKLSFRRQAVGFKIGM